MADRRFPIVDFASTVVAPVLVMGMVGSLCFFLIEVLQAGKFEGRLHYTFFFFVLGTVLIARLSITDGQKKAVFYGAGLALVSFIAMNAFVSYGSPLFKVLGPILNIGIMAIVWWAAHRLTKDCTHFEDSRKASGRGVLAAVGLDGAKATTASEDEAEYRPDRSQEATRKKSKRGKGEPAPGWWQRFQQYREWRKTKPHTPGVGVFYFAVAAIPLFALGQALIPADDAARRGNTFWQMAVYIGSALGLLVTTTLMGLKRYLEDRQASIPLPLTIAWLGLGGVLIALFLGVAALLPRPHSETPLVDLGGGEKQKRSASQNAQVRDKSAGEGQGAKGEKKEAGDGSGSAKGGKPGGQGQGQANKGQGQNKGGNQSGGQKGDKNSGNEKNDQSKEGGKQQEKKEPGKDDTGDKNGKNDKNEDGKSENDGKADDKSSGDDAERSNDAGKSLQQLSNVFEGVSEVVKWIVWIALAVLLVGGGIYFAVKYLANFTGWAQGLLDWFRGLFGKKPAKPKKAASAEAIAVEEVQQRLPPFTEFSNPFTDGTAKQLSTRELVAYTFAAFEAWASDRGWARQPGETPSEFVRRLSEDEPAIEKPGLQLADALIRSLYSTADLPKTVRPALADFWQTLEGSLAVA